LVAFEKRPATAVAIEAWGVVAIPEREFSSDRARCPEIVRLAGLTRRLITLNKRLADMTGRLSPRGEALHHARRENDGATPAES
jgi:hypothetical protein